MRLTESILGATRKASGRGVSGEGKGPLRCPMAVSPDNRYYLFDSRPKIINTWNRGHSKPVCQLRAEKSSQKWKSRVLKRMPVWTSIGMGAVGEKVGLDNSLPLW